MRVAVILIPRCSNMKGVDETGCSRQVGGTLVTVEVRDSVRQQFEGFNKMLTGKWVSV